METMENQFNEQEALKVMNEQISIAKGNLDDGYFYFTLWGAIIAIFYLLNYYFIKSGLTDYAGDTYILYAIGGIISFIYAKKQDKKKRVNTYIEKWMAYIWLTFGIQWGITIIFIAMYLKQPELSVPVFLMLIGGSALISGGLVKFKPLIVGGVICFIFAMAAFVVSLENTYLLAGVAMITGIMLPGFIYRRMHKNENV